MSANNVQADLIIGNNVYAHVPDINDFTKGLKASLEKRWNYHVRISTSFALIDDSQFDTIYHEHFSYLSLFTVCRIFRSVGLRVFNVEQLSTHGGNLRVYGCHTDDTRETSVDVYQLIDLENYAGLQKFSYLS